ncbi:MAG: DUF3105 domain-containing protein [Deinococcus-Thermus bacterium]|jgi:hypothetical protein|nr:DUF3105 domain-containing protein [Deinococcota bacterium]
MPQKKRSKRRRSRRGPNRAAWIVGIVGVAALIAVPIVIEAVQAANLPGDRFASQGNRHVPLGTEVPAYNSDPPTSGPHTDALAGWGTYGPGEAPPDQRLLHNMEDGGVVLWYRPAENAEATEGRIAALEDVARSYRRIVIAPRPDMPTDFALTAWQRLQRFETIDQEAMGAFVDAYEGLDHHVR